MATTNRTTGTYRLIHDVEWANGTYVANPVIANSFILDGYEAVHSWTIRCVSNEMERIGLSDVRWGVTVDGIHDSSVYFCVEVGDEKFEFSLVKPIMTEKNFIEMKIRDWFTFVINEESVAMSKAGG